MGRYFAVRFFERTVVMQYAAKLTETFPFRPPHFSLRRKRQFFAPSKKLRVFLQMFIQVAKVIDQSLRCGEVFHENEGVFGEQRFDILPRRPPNDRNNAGAKSVPPCFLGDVIATVERIFERHEKFVLNDFPRQINPASFDGPKGAGAVHVHVKSRFQQIQNQF